MNTTNKTLAELLVRAVIKEAKYTYKESELTEDWINDIADGFDVATGEGTISAIDNMADTLDDLKDVLEGKINLQMVKRR